mgnify:FL=1
MFTNTPGCTAYFTFQLWSQFDQGGLMTVIMHAVVNMHMYVQSTYCYVALLAYEMSL